MSFDLTNSIAALKPFAEMILAAMAVLGAHFYWRTSYEERVNLENVDASERPKLLYRIRAISVAAFAAQSVVIFVFRPDTGKDIDLGIAIYLAAILLHSHVQFEMERKLRKFAAPGRQNLKIGLMALGWVFLGMALTGAFAKTLGEVFELTSRELGFSKTAIVWLTAGGTVLGLLGGLYALGLMTPVFMRQLYPCSKIEGPTRELIERCFQKAGLKTPSLWILNLEHFNSHNAMVVGMAAGRGAFAQSLFLTRSLVTQLEPRELEAVLLHEVSHIKLEHILKRILFSAGSVLLIAVALTLGISAIVALFFVNPKMVNAKTISYVSITTLLGAFVASQYLARRQVYKQEAEADAYAVFTLGADLQAMASALRKLDMLNDQLSDRKDPQSYLSVGSAHPTTEKRIQLLQERAERDGLGKLAA